MKKTQNPNDKTRPKEWLGVEYAQRDSEPSHIVKIHSIKGTGTMRDLIFYDPKSLMKSGLSEWYLTCFSPSTEEAFNNSKLKSVSKSNKTMKTPFFKFVGTQTEFHFVCSHWRTVPKIGESYSIYALFTLLLGDPNLPELDRTLSIGALLENIKKQPLLWIETTDDKAKTPLQLQVIDCKEEEGTLAHNGFKKSIEEHKPKAFFPKNELDPLNDYMNQMKFGCVLVRSELPRPHPMDVVTLNRLQTMLKYFDIEIHPTILDKVIDVVELLIDKGDKTSLMDMEALRQEWIDHQSPIKGIISETILKDIDIERAKAMFVPKKAF